MYATAVAVAANPAKTTACKKNKLRYDSKRSEKKSLFLDIVGIVTLSTFNPKYVNHTNRIMTLHWLNNKTNFEKITLPCISVINTY